MKPAALLLAVSIAVAGCVSSADYPKKIYEGEPDPRSKELVLGVGDIIAINVWENGNLNTESVIRPDGTITMPLVGDLKAVGETPSSLTQRIKDRLAEFLKLPAGQPITIAVKSWNSYRFRVDGEVVKPGIVASNQYITVADAIALAGGPTRFAKRDKLRILRTDPKTHSVHIIPMDYDLLISGTRPDMNIFVLPGDAITLP